MSRRAAAQSEGRRRRDPARQDDRLLRPERLGQKLAGDGHDLRRGPAAVRRKPQLLRPAVRRPDAEAGGRAHRRACRRPSPSSRSTWATRRARRSAPSPRSTTTCGSCCARLGQPYCPDCDIPIGTQTADEIIDKIMAEPAGTKLYLMAPLEIEVGEKYETLWDEMRAAGYVRMRVDGKTHSRRRSRRTIDRRRKHQVEVVIDRVIVRPDARSRIADSVENALSLGKGVLHVAYRRRRRARAEVADRGSQPALRLRPVRPQLRAAHAAQLFVQQPAGLVPGVRRTGHADRRQSGGAAARSEADAGRRAPSACGRRSSNAAVPARCSTALVARTPACRSTCRSSSSTPSSGGSCCTARARSGSTSTPPASARRPTGRCSAFSTRGSIPRSKKRRGCRRRLRGKLEHLVDEVECSTCGGSRLRDDAAAVRLPRAARSTSSAACRWASCSSEFDGWKLDATRTQDRRRAAPRDSQPLAVPGRRRAWTT